MKRPLFKSDPSYDRRRQLVEEAIHNRWGNKDEPSWIRELYDDRAIFESGGGLFEVPYLIDDHESVTLGERKRVEVEYSPVVEEAFRYANRSSAQFSRLPGGRYRARQGDDGKWDILDVPIFSTIPKGVKGAPKDIEEDDLREAVEIHQRKFNQDKHVSRLNVLHNFSIHKAEGAGFVLPKCVQSFRLDGATVPVIFADFLSVSEEVFRLIEDNGLPFCSIEIRTWEPLQFGACALLDTEDPFFQFPNITIGDKQELVTSSADVTRFHSKREPCLAAFVSGDDSRFLFRFGDADMPDDEKKKNDEKKDGDGQMVEEGGDALDIKAITKAIESGSISVADMDAIVAAVDAQKAASPAEEEVAEDEAGPIDLDGPPALTHKKPAAKMSAGETKSEARISALEDFKANVIAEKARDKSFNAAVDQLEEAGHSLSDGTRDRLFKAAGAGKETLALFVSEYEETAPKDPPPDLDGGPGSEGAYPSEVVAYFNRGPEEATQAKRVWREWQELKEHPAFGATVSSLEKYLERNMRAVGG